jgi:flavin reductase (DIM6/NTAB) family NADH-FMN oxidoreductase RutF
MSAAWRTSRAPVSGVYKVGQCLGLPGVAPTRSRRSGRLYAPSTKVKTPHPLHQGVLLRFFTSTITTPSSPLPPLVVTNSTNEPFPQVPLGEARFASINFQQLNMVDRYKLMCAAVVPRPIAFISTIDLERNIPNLAPLSFFNAVTSDPPTVMFSLTRRKDGSKKDTLNNIERYNDFVINHVTKEIFPQCYEASTEFPPEVDEFKEVGLTPLESLKVKAPRVKESPIHMECKLHKAIEIGDGQYGSATIIVGRIVYMHVLESCYENGNIISHKVNTISRLADMGYGTAEHKFDVHGSAWSVSNW